MNDVVVSSMVRDRESALNLLAVWIQVTTRPDTDNPFEDNGGENAAPVYIDTMIEATFVYKGNWKTLEFDQEMAESRSRPEASRASDGKGMENEPAPV